MLADQTKTKILADSDAPKAGLIALVGATVSVIFCYGQILISLITPLFGMAAFELNIHLQAVCMWLFGLVTVYGVYRERHIAESQIPVGLAIIAVLIIAGTLYTVYDVRVLILGYALLVMAALLNQILMLSALKRQVEARAGELNDLNDNLARRVDDQVGEIQRLARLKRFLAPEVADLITNERKEGLLHSHRRRIACLFCDIRNFTPLAETLEPEEVMEVLQVFHEHMDRLITQSRGTLGYRAGDGLMVFFNDPLPCDEPSLEAAKLAIEMRDEFSRAGEKWERIGHKIGVGIGIASGYATLGMVGGPSRRDYTAIGKAVNLASRLCDKAGHDEILLDRRAFLEVEDSVVVEAPRTMRLKGIGDDVEAHPLTRLAPSAATATGERSDADPLAR